MATGGVFGVTGSKAEDLLRRMQELYVAEADIEEHFVRSSGAGGQNVNKTATCVYLRHRVSGIEVKCQRERSQAINRFLARRMLVDKIDRIIRGRASEQARIRAKIRKQKQKRSKRSRAKLREEKAVRTGKKELRRRVRPEKEGY